MNEFTPLSFVFFLQSYHSLSVIIIIIIILFAFCLAVYVCTCCCFRSFLFVYLFVRFFSVFMFEQVNIAFIFIQKNDDDYDDGLAGRTCHFCCCYSCSCCCCCQESSSFFLITPTSTSEIHNFHFNRIDHHQTDKQTYEMDEKNFLSFIHSTTK